MRLIDLTGQRFGRLVVTSRVANTGTHPQWNCLCDCGNQTISSSTDLRRQDRKRRKVSCGCYAREMSRLRMQNQKISVKHGACDSPTHQSWMAMNTRCTNQNRRVWRHYGGRGISICERWRGPQGFSNFFADMGERPVGKTLDRFPDCDGDYEPSNCRWATWHEQRMNQRRMKNKIVEHSELLAHIREGNEKEN